MNVDKSTKVVLNPLAKHLELAPGRKCIVSWQLPAENCAKALRKGSPWLFLKNHMETHHFFVFSSRIRSFKTLHTYPKEKFNADEFNLIYFKRIVKVEYFIEKSKYGKIQEFRMNKKKYSSL